MVDWNIFVVAEEIWTTWKNSVNMKGELANDPSFQALTDVMRVLEGSRTWAGDHWHHNPIHPPKYISLIPKVQAALNTIKKEYETEK